MKDPRSSLDFTEQTSSHCNIKTGTFLLNHQHVLWQFSPFLICTIRKPVLYTRLRTYISQSGVIYDNTSFKYGQFVFCISKENLQQGFFSIIMFFFHRQKIRFERRCVVRIQPLVLFFLYITDFVFHILCMWRITCCDNLKSSCHNKCFWLF